MNRLSSKANQFRTGREQQYIWFWFTFLTALASVAAYYTIYTGFGSWDDEGTVMLAVKQYLAGMKLYDQIPTRYGPVYYLYSWALRSVSGTPVTHDVVRLSSLLPWLSSALVCAWIVYRFTKSVVLASATHLFTFCTLFCFQYEAGHPQELCILLMLCLVACGIWTQDPRRRTLAVILLGVLVAALLFVKVNIGIFMILASSLALLLHAPKTKFAQFASAAAGAVYIILPFVLMRSHLYDKAAREYCLLVSAAATALLLMECGLPRTTYFSFQDCWGALAGFVCTLTAIILVLVAQGVSLHGVLDSLLYENLSVSMNKIHFYVPITVSRLWFPSIIMGLVTAVYFAWKAREKEITEYQLSWLKLIVAVSAGIVAFILHRSLLGFVTPFCWLILQAPSDQWRTAQTFPRTLFCAIAVVQTLWAYPVAGSQSSFVQVLLIIVVMVCLGDFFEYQRSRQRFAWHPVLKGSAAVLLFSIPVSYVAIDAIQRKNYNFLPPLLLPGAKRVHATTAQVADYHWLVRNLHEHCDVFISMPEIPSLHLWAAQDPLAGSGMSQWMQFLNNDQQAAVAAALSDHPNACAIYNEKLVAFWNQDQQDIYSSPLAREIYQHFKTVAVMDGYHFLVRNERRLVIVSTP
jgi:hypothetical protein